MYLTFHSYGQYWLIPWGYDVEYPADYSDLKKLAVQAAASCSKYKYTVGNSAELLYPAAGMNHFHWVWFGWTHFESLNHPVETVRSLKKKRSDRLRNDNFGLTWANWIRFIRLVWFGFDSFGFVLFEFDLFDSFDFGFDSFDFGSLDPFVWILFRFILTDSIWIQSIWIQSIWINSIDSFDSGQSEFDCCSSDSFDSTYLFCFDAGGSDDWAKGGAGIKYSYTIELPDTGSHGFIMPSSNIKPVCEDIFPALKVLAAHVASSYPLSN